MSDGYILPMAEARRRKAANRHARWRQVIEDFEGEVWPEVEPSFRLQPGQTVFTIGSCFARNIETHLKALGCVVPMLDFWLPPTEWDGPPHSAMNRFHPPAFRQCLEWTATIHDRDGVVRWEDCEALAFDLGTGWFDLDMAPTLAVTRERLIERRQHIYDIFSTVFSADCMMMTPGLVEAWRDTTSGLYLYDAPHQKAMLALRDRWAFEILPYERCMADMLAAVDAVRARNPTIKVLVTTSPVPMGVTFSGKDVRIANSYSKSVLRAVCGDVAMRRTMTDYFPSFESVTLSAPRGVWKSDRLHVSQGFIGKIVGYMLDRYLEGVEESARAYQQALACLGSADYPGAEAAARAVIAARPGHVEARAVLAEALLRQRRPAEAAGILEPLVAADPERADLLVKLARALAAQPGGEAGAIAAIERAMASSSFTLAEYLPIEGLLAAFEAAAAERLARRAVDLLPLNVEVYPVLADLLIGQGRKAEAAEVLGRAVRLSKPPARLLVQLAELTREAGDVGQARTLVQAALAAEPKNQAAGALAAELTRPPGR